MNHRVKKYMEQFHKTLDFSDICWWIIDYENDPDHFYCNDYMLKVFSLDKDLEKHSVSLTCPIAGDYNKNISLALNSRGKAKQIFDDYARLVNQEQDEYVNVFPYFDDELGENLYFKSRAKVLDTNESGEVALLYGIIEDITLQETQNLKIQRSTEILEKNVMTFTTDIFGVITHVSQASCESLSYVANDLLGCNIKVVLDSEVSDKAYLKLLASLKKEHVWKGELKLNKGNQESFWSKLTVSEEYDCMDKLIGYRLICYDINAEKAKDDFFSNMSHELRTPLNAILGFTGVMERTSKDKKSKEYLSYIGSSAKQLLDLISDILDLAKIQNGDFQLAPHSFFPYNEMNTLLQHFKILSEQNDIHFNGVISDNFRGEFYGDWLRISQTLSNLISNAVKFTPKGGNVEVTMTYEKGLVNIKVTDSGIGMSQSEQKKIFKVFTQANSTTTRKYGGTGLGLNIVQKLTDIMHGNVTLQSEEGKGEYL